MAGPARWIALRRKRKGKREKGKGKGKREKGQRTGERPRALRRESEKENWCPFLEFSLAASGRVDPSPD
jgi:hypothetical protein